MSHEVSIICDGCSVIIASDDTKAKAIKSCPEKITRRNGKDYCVECVARGRHTEDDEPVNRYYPGKASKR